MIQNIEEFCRLYYETTHIPLSLYSIPASTTTSFPEIMSDISIFRGMLPNFSQLNQNPDYFISESFAYYGYIYVESAQSALVIGPIFGTPCSDNTVRAFMKEWSIHPNNKEEITQFLSTTPTHSFAEVLKILAYLHLCLNDEIIDITERFHLTSTEPIAKLSTLHTDLVYENRENQNYHNTWNFERQLMQLIQSGDTDKLQEFLMHAQALNAGNIADNTLRQEKNIFITSVSLAMRSAINGGMDMEQAYQLSDLYIQECERSTSIERINTLSYSMLMDFTKRVSASKIPEGMSQEIFACIQFIHQNINRPIQVSDVAEHIGKSRSYLSTRFKQEMGFDISSFIMRCRLEEAKSLLTYSDKSLSEISEYLCFSSQSYFQNVFKKKYGMTPRKYRQENSGIQ